MEATEQHHATKKTGQFIHHVGRDTEFLPDQRLMGAAVSAQYLDYQLAAFSLHHIQAKASHNGEFSLVSYRLEDGHDDDKERYVRIKRSDDAYRKMYQKELAAFALTDEWREREEFKRSRRL